MTILKATLYNDRDGWQSFRLLYPDDAKIALQVRSTSANVVLWSWRAPKGTRVFRRRHGSPDRIVPCQPGATSKYGQYWESLIFVVPDRDPVAMDVLSVTPERILCRWEAPRELAISRT